MVIAALRDRLPRSAWRDCWSGQNVLGWHRALVRRKWAAHRGRAPQGGPPISMECRPLIMAKETLACAVLRCAFATVRLASRR
jgi:hypothetical protein